MRAIVKEFESARRDIYLQKHEFSIEAAVNVAKYFSFEKVESDGGSVVLNDKFVITKKHVTRLCKLLQLKSPKELAEVVKHQKFQRIKLGELWLVWFTAPDYVLGFLRTQYESRTSSELSIDNTTTLEFLNSLFSEELHADIVALAYVTKPFKNPELASFSKPYLCLKHIKSLVRFFLDSKNEYSDYIRKQEQAIIFNSKLLGRDNLPIVIRAKLDDFGNVNGIDIVEEEMDPLHLEFIIDRYTVAGSSVLIDKTARLHLRKYKFRDYVSVVSDDTISELIKSVSNSLSMTLYIKDLIVPIVYKNRSSIAVRIIDPEFGACYAVGNYPDNGVFSVRTLMPPEIVALNHMSVTCMYSTGEVM